MTTKMSGNKQVTKTTEVESHLQKLKFNEVSGEPVALANSEDLLRLLECPVCSSLQVAPIFNCELGHSICFKCRQKTKACPTCARPFTTARNFLAESISETARVTCAYKDKGCPVVTTVSEHAAHVAACELRPILCNLTKGTFCHGTPVDLSSYFQHLIDSHGILGHEVVTYDTFCDKIERISVLNDGAKWPPFYIRIHDKIFLKHTTFLNGNLYWWLVLLSANPNEADDYQSTIVIPLCKSNDMTIRYSVPVHHYRRSSNDIIGSGVCASLPFNSIIPFCRSETENSTTYIHCWDMQFSVTKKTSTPLSFTKL